MGLLLTSDDAAAAAGVGDLAVVDGEVGRWLAAIESDLPIGQLACWAGNSARGADREGAPTGTGPCEAHEAAGDGAERDAIESFG